MNSVQFDLMPIHTTTGAIRYDLTREEYFDFRQLIEFGGKKIIGGTYLQANKECLSHHKKASFDSGTLSIPLDGVIDILNEAERIARLDNE